MQVVSHILILLCSVFSKNINQVDYTVFGQMLIVKPNAIVAYTNTCDSLFAYSTKANEIISSIDGSNALNPLAFIYNQQKILIFNRQLNVLRTLRAIDLGLYDIGAVCRSNDNQLWLADNFQHKLYKFDDYSLNQSQSFAFGNFVDKDWQSIQIAENSNFVVVLDSAKGFLKFDRFGTFIRKIDIENVSYFKIFDDNVVFVKHNKLYSFSLQGVVEISPFLSQISEPILQFDIYQYKIAITTEDGIKVYELQNK